MKNTKRFDHGLVIRKNNMALLLNKFVFTYIMILTMNSLWTQHIIKTKTIGKRFQDVLKTSQILIIFFFFSKTLIVSEITFYLYITLSLNSVLISKIYLKCDESSWAFIVIGILFSSNFFLLKPSALNLTIILELVSIVIAAVVLITGKTQITYKKVVYMALITANIIVLSFLVLNQLFIVVIAGCWDLDIVFFLLEYKNQKSAILFMYVVILLKLGIFLGPSYNHYIYSSVSRLTLTAYMLLYYVILIALVAVYAKFIYITQWLLVAVWFIIFVTNRSFLTNQTKQELLFYWSNQISLFYVQLLLI